MSLSRRRMVGGLLGASLLPLGGCASGGAIPRPSLPSPLPEELGLDAVIDLNHSNSVTDFSLARSVSTILGVVHKASEGNDWVDPLYERRRQMALGAGMLWGAYHFGTHQHSGAEQAANFLAAAQPDAKTLMALDLELNERAPANSMDLWQAEDFVRSILLSTGRLPVLYVQPGWANGDIPPRGRAWLGGAITTQSILAHCDLWLADYRLSPELPRAWAGGRWQLWQYAGDNGPGGSGPYGERTRQVSGVRRCDRNIFNGDRAALALFWQGRADVS